MKIGELSKITDVPVNAIRYYINTGLLVPNSKNKQYVFNEDDLDDLEEIIVLKSYKFSLNDIHRILSLKRVTNLADGGDMNDYLNFFTQQRKVLKEERHQLDEVLNRLTEKIHDIRNTIETEHAKTGVPLSMINLIACPSCSKQLHMKDCNIESKYILSGELTCDCGYTAKIKEGILCTKGGFISSYDYPDLERNFYKNIPAPFISVLQKSYNWLLSQMEVVDLKNKVIFEDHMNAYFFSYRHIELMEKTARYIMADKYFDIVKMYKNRIESLDLDLDILFIADATFNLPIRKESIDVFIDYFSTNEYSFFNTHYLMDKLEPYFHQNTDILGTYFYYNDTSKSRKQALLDYPETWDKNFNLKSFQRNFIHQTYKEIASEEVGGVSDTGNCEAFSFHIEPEEMFLHCYNWRKI